MPSPNKPTPAKRATTDSLATPQANGALRTLAAAPVFFGRRLTLRQFLTHGVVPIAMLLAMGLVGIPPLARALAADDPAADDPAGNNPAAPPAQRSMAAVPVTTMRAKLETSYQVQKAYTGTLVAGRRSSLALERAGRVIQLEVDEGAQVAAGQTLAQIDSRRLDASRRLAAAELAEAQAVLAELVAGPRGETIATARAEVRSLAAQRDAAQRNLNRRRTLVESAAISEEEYDESLYAMRTAEARVDAAQKQLDELEAGVRKERVDAQQARVAALEAKLADVDHQLEDSTLTAPFAGAIAQRHLDEGAVVAAGEPLFDLIETDRLEAWIGVPVESARRLKVGQPLNVVINGAQREATIRSIRAELNPTTRTQNVVLTINKAPGVPAVERLVAGQVARVLLAETIADSGFWAPASSLKPHRRGLWAVAVAEQTGETWTVALRDVELLHTEGRRSFVRGALQPGEQIIVAGAHKVVEGQRVAIAPNK